MRPLERRLRTSSTSVLDTLFPPACAGLRRPAPACAGLRRPAPACAGCGRRGHWVCSDCRGSVPPLGTPACDRCGALRADRCTCEDLPGAVISIRSALPFHGWVREAIHSFKYQGERARARHLGDLLPQLIPVGTHVDAVVPIPLHPRRARERGFNQATLLARRFSASLDESPVVEIARTGSLTPQVGLAAAERTANVAGAFVVPDPGLVTGRHLILLDDVITTTATMTACARALAEAGALTIRCVSVARAD